MFVYYQVDTTVTPGEASTEASSFSAGRAAVTGICGAGLGALVTALAMTTYTRRKGKKETAAA